MLSFDEFRAVRNREKKKAPVPYDDITGNGTNQVPAGKKTNKTSYFSQLTSSVGDFFETHQMQAFYIAMLYLETFVSFAEIFLESQPKYLVHLSFFKRSGYLLKALKSFTAFTNFVFATEIIIIIAIFGIVTFGHLGYLTDMVVISAQIYLDSKGYGKETRLLNLLRFWRLARLFNSFIDIERNAHDETMKKLEHSELDTQKMVIENASLKSDIIKEREARNSIEDMLLNYKEEVDTLNEALKIAAMDIAEVANGEGDDEYLQMSDVDDDEFDNDDHGLNGEDDTSDHHMMHQRPSSIHRKQTSAGGGAGSAGDSVTSLGSSNSSVQKQHHPSGGNNSLMHRLAGEYDEDEQLLFADAMVSKYSKYGSKEAMLRAVMEDSQAQHQQQHGGNNSSAASLNSKVSTATPTFVVAEDGTFVKK